MLVDAPATRFRLSAMVARLAPPHWREDLLQEALIHLWRLEEQDPGREEDWYLRGCRFHLQNSLRQGRSVDSLKRVRSQVCECETTFDDWDLLDRGTATGSFWEDMSVNDFTAQLSLWLTPREQATLGCLMDGMSARETAKRLDISHTMVNRHRSQIANLAVKLGMNPAPLRPITARSFGPCDSAL